MKVIIAGSRSIIDYNLVKSVVIDSGFNITEVVCGEARGVDILGRKWANENDIPIKSFIPDWDTLGRKAGMIRNGQMADYADALVVIWDGVSPGTDGMIKIATRKKLKIYIHRTDLSLIDIRGSILDFLE